MYGGVIRGRPWGTGAAWLGVCGIGTATPGTTPGVAGLPPSAPWFPEAS